ncbi:MAG: class I SAM-dependent DNA methyltransferase [Sporomusaceae bacterium]|nr:class I SAM-dependent DNA methyltransferase [Sporomusaceae bacterium]
MAERITQQELESYLWGSATLLRGNIDAGDYKQYIFPLLFYKRICDVYDEEYAAALEESEGNETYALNEDNHRFQVPKGAHWTVTREKSNNIGKALQLAFRAIEKANQEKLNGVFGDAPWTNKNRLPDELLKELIEHFSSKTLSITNCPEDELGVGYEYLIKKFADDSGHTAQEFYTNRTVVHLMTEMLDPQPGESIYDPTCGSAGMLISTIAYLKEQGREWRNVKLYGQELNHLTSAIGRMNVFLHGVEDFQIVQGDTLIAPAFLDKSGKLMQFDMVLANPPYSIKQWNRDAFSTDPYGRNFLGTPPQGRADYAFLQHILMSLNKKTGRCAILFPHGVLFRHEEAEMRRNLVELDLVECVLGLGKNLFYNSPMEACIMICRMNKPAERKNKVLFINAVHEVTRERAQSFLGSVHIEKIAGTYHDFCSISSFSAIVVKDEILKNDGSLSIPLYINTGGTMDSATAEFALGESIDAWQHSSIALKRSLDALLQMFSDTPPDDPGDNPETEDENISEDTMSQNGADKRQLPPPAYLRSLLAAEIVYQNYQEARFGSVKLEKLIYLCDAHFGLGDMIEQHYLRKAAGPYDPKGMRSIRDNLLSHKWFTVKKVDNRATKYLPMPNCGGHREAYAMYFSEYRQQIQIMLDCMKNWKTQQCEIIATLYSAWADFLEEGTKPRDEQIVNEVLVNWNESKLKIPVEKWREGLQWMKQNGLYPGGSFGKEAHSYEYR